ncbi:hypothetical protein EJB05_34396, partial [Eragrostis curvula]
MAPSSPEPVPVSVSSPVPTPAAGSPLRPFATIIIFQLEVLQTYCALIGSLKPYEPTRNAWGSNTRYAARGEPSFGGKCKPAVEVMPSSTSLSAEPAGLKVLAQIKDENLGYSDKPDIISVKAVISFIDTESFCYAVCPLVVNGMPCNAKVECIGDRMWHCKRCFQDIETCDYRYKVHIQIQDYTGTSSAIMHQKASNKIFGRTAKELYFLKDEPQDFPWFENIMHGVLCTQYLFKLKVEAKPLSYGSYGRHVSTVLEAEKVDPSAEANRLLGVIDKLSKKGSRSNSEVCSGIPAYIGLSDFQVRSSAQSPNSGPAISLGRASWLGSMDGLGPINRYALKPASTLTSTDCGSGFGGHCLQTCDLSSRCGWTRTCSTREIHGQLLLFFAGQQCVGLACASNPSRLLSIGPKHRAGKS